MIDLRFWPTPNGKKVTILLEEADIAYNIKPINIGRGDHVGNRCQMLHHRLLQMNR
jgi:glutathione S-transferase